MMHIFCSNQILKYFADIIRNMNHKFFWIKPGCQNWGCFHSFLQRRQVRLNETDQNFSHDIRFCITGTDPDFYPTKHCQFVLRRYKNKQRICRQIFFCHNKSREDSIIDRFNHKNKNQVANGTYQLILPYKDHLSLGRPVILTTVGSM